MSRLTRAQRIIGVYPNPVCGTDTLTQGGHVTWHAIPGVPGTVYSQGTNTWRDEVPSPEHGSPVVAPTALSSAPSYAFAQNYALSTEDLTTEDLTTEDLTSSAVETSTAATNDPAAASASSAAHKLASAAHDPIIDSDDEEEDVEELVVPTPGQSSAAPTAHGHQSDNDDGNEEELPPLKLPLHAAHLNIDNAHSPAARRAILARPSKGMRCWFLEDILVYDPLKRPKCVKKTKGSKTAYFEEDGRQVKEFWRCQVCDAYRVVDPKVTTAMIQHTKKKCPSSL